MIYTVTWSPKSKKRLNKLEQKITISIIKKVEEIKTNPFHFLERLTKIKAFKLRVGDYRVIIEINGNERKLEVLALGHRKDVYKEIQRLFS